MSFVAAVFLLFWVVVVLGEFRCCSVVSGGCVLGEFRYCSVVLGGCVLGEFRYCSVVLGGRSAR